MPRYQLTPEQAKKGWRNSLKARKLEAKLRKKEASAAEVAAFSPILASALQSPVIAGLIAYVGVMVLQQAAQSYQKATAAPDTTPDSRGVP